MKLSDAKKVKMNTLSKSIMSHMNPGNMSKVEEKAFQTKIEDYLVEWGVSARIVSSATDYKGVAQLLAAAAASAD